MHPRLAATIALIPLGIGTWVAGYTLALSWAFRSSPGTPPVDPELYLTLLCCSPLVFTYIAPVLIWWTAVRWTPMRRIGVIGTTLILFAALLAPLLLDTIDTELRFALLLSISIMGGSIAIIIVSIICYSPPAERGGPRSAACPRCGYDLQGQRECRCPECGLQLTVGELLSGARDEDENAAGVSDGPRTPP